MQKTNIRQKLLRFTEEGIKEFDERREKRLRGETKTYSWEEAKEIITKKKII
jgi:hypothetical protein